VRISLKNFASTGGASGAPLPEASDDDLLMILPFFPGNYS
jgi:hypothetical protein